MTVPRAALADTGSLWVVDADDKLRLRNVEVLRLEGDLALIADGLDERDRVSLLPPRLARPGLAVRPVQATNLANRPSRLEPAS